MTNFRKRLQNQQVVLGQMVLELFTPGIGPMLAAAGMNSSSSIWSTADAISV